MGVPSVHFAEVQFGGIAFLCLLQLGCPCPASPGIILDIENSPTQANLRGVAYREHYEDDRPAIAVGDNGTVLVRDEAQWTTRSADTDEDLRGVAYSYRYDNIAVVVGANGTILRTADKGDSWNPVDSTSGARLNGVAFGHESVAIAVGDRNIVYSGDGGASWQQADLPSELGELAAVASLVTVRGGYQLADFFLTVGSGGQVWKSLDGGATWIHVESGTVVDFTTASRALFLSGEDDKLLVGDSDGGLRIATVSADDNVKWAHLSETSESVSSVSTQGVWLLTADGALTILGEDPTVQATIRWEGGAQLRAIGGDYTISFAVGDGGTILRAELPFHKCS